MTLILSRQIYTLLDSRTKFLVTCPNPLPPPPCSDLTTATWGGSTVQSDESSDNDSDSSGGDPPQQTIGESFSWIFELPLVVIHVHNIIVFTQGIMLYLD